MISGKTISLLVGGSIAAYKSAELVRELVKNGAEVNVVMSKAACEFISPLTMQTLSGRPVATEMFDLDREATISHIRLADSADVVVVAPATADIIAKSAAGIADDCLTTVLLATRAPIVFSPAMNVNMWTNPITQRNVEYLMTMGRNFVAPEDGQLACGWFGPGRLAEVDAIIEELMYVLTPKDLKGSRVLVTAGPTWEAIDPIRFVSNRSSGKMGHALARVAKLQGADVTLITGPTSLKAPRGVKRIAVESAQQMRDAVISLVRQPAEASGTEVQAKKANQFVFMAAAVTDHSPADPSSTKQKRDKKAAYSLKMVPAPDILQELGDTRKEIETQSGLTLKLVGFTAETGEEEELIEWARDKLQRKNVDLMVGNTADDSFGKDTNRVWLLERGGRQEEVAMADKLAVAARIIRAALKV